MVSPQVKDLDTYIRKQNSKLTQVVQNFFTKAVQIILGARSEDEDELSHDQKINKWFNLLMASSNAVNKDELKLWKSCGDLSIIPPMIIETSLDLRSLSHENALVLKDDTGNVWEVVKGVNSKKQEVVVERWLIEFDPNDVSGSIMDELPLIYKQAIILFRSLYGFLRLMPVYKLRQRLAKNPNGRLKVVNKVLDGKQPISSKGRIGLSKSIIPQQMLSTESHLVQRNFHPIHTTLGTLKVSTIYRRHADFVVHDNEEVLSSHFIHMDDKDTSVLPELEVPAKDIANTASMSISPSTAREPSPAKRDTPPAVSGRPAIQPFKVGSISSSPPPFHGPFGPSSLERRISITSNKSTSNASLAAMLRNPRGSNSSTTGNIPISSTASQHALSSVPRSVSSSHGDADSPNPDGVATTPRFSSSFGSRASRRFSNTSVRQSVLHQTFNDHSYLGTSAGSITSVNPMSGIYIDDDISDFVRMIDNKTDLRLSSPGSNQSNVEKPPSGSDVLNKFQLMKFQHQQFGDSVNQSLILQSGSNPPSLNNPGSQVSSRKSSTHSATYSPVSRSPFGHRSNPSNQNLPTIDSKLETEPKPPAAAPETSVGHGDKPREPGVVRGLATTPSVYANRRSIQYENVFEDDDDGEDYYLQSKSASKPEEEDDDLLFTMSDMNLTKH
ncbi:autophagy protein 13 [Yamadazyma tenuis]|uniref:Autophagy-related protein 13 n=1 Tax=Candida tenuis (strain ATCC 10573 / BCRC 21748 / CBS 615 / JCM 9827 / NBRC 10315 / NRRL Y-1498 / VKM Y-70) TaxID=590646 RepID=G3AZW1_CANTC|nr:uncharacterized protein CANTEDRAFT_92480 [Yamadazyma tenuis ATCC 10573]EGV65253.1 hypothetical protein CANTEDRAFT_92480 [Yamadazyma tenuis ATCC 10573]WEJ95091.1 autophagy protein 13 [Yamadazyma tenuis]